MHIHRLEKIWLVIGISMLIVFLSVVGVGAFALGMQPPSSHHGAHTIDPEKVRETAPFDNLGLEKIGENEYNAYMVAYAFSFDPKDIEIPAGAKVDFYVTSTDVVHGFQVPGTNLI